MLKASQFSLEGAVEDGGEEGVQFGGSFGLEALEGVDLGLESVEFGDDAALVGQRGDGHVHLLRHFCVQVWLALPTRQLLPKPERLRFE